MKSIVIYKSKTGFTKKYAKIISKSINSDCYSIKKSKKLNLNNYDLIIYGGSLYASGIIGLKKIKKRIGSKKLIVFAVGVTPEKKDLEEKLLKANFSPDEQNKIKLFYLRGGFDFNKLNFIDRKLMSVMKKKVEKKDNLTSDDIAFINSFDKPIDYVNEKSTEKLINHYNDEVCKND